MLHPAFTSQKTWSRSDKPLKSKKRKNQIKIAILDIGTNSLRFDMYEVRNKTMKRIFRKKRMVRLGDGVFKTGRLTPEGMQRCLSTLADISEAMQELRVDQVYAFGTSALRTASNTKEFIAEVKAKTGISIRVISGNQEGDLIAKGILANEELFKGLTALIDIGGGSTEVSLSRGQKILERHSFDLGANRLQQMFLVTTPPLFKKGELHPILALRQHIREKILPVFVSKKFDRAQFCFGSSGTIRTLSRILKKIRKGGKGIDRTELSALLAEMSHMKRDTLKQLPGLEPKRVDLILAGSVLLEELMFALGVRKLSVTPFALRDGILVEVLEKL